MEKQELPINIDVFSSAISLIFILIWLAGIVIAEGVWSTLFSIIIPPWAWYLFVEKMMYLCGIL